MESRVSRPRREEWFVSKLEKRPKTKNKNIGATRGAHRLQIKRPQGSNSNPNAVEGNFNSVTAEL